MHQKQPPAKVATASPSSGVAAGSCCPTAAAGHKRHGRGDERRDETTLHQALRSAWASAGTNFSATPFMQ